MILFLFEIREIAGFDILVFMLDFSIEVWYKFVDGIFVNNGF